MSFAARPGFESSIDDGPVGELNGMSVTPSTTGGTGSTGTVSLGSNGTMGFVGGVGPSHWFTPTTGGVGVSYWVKFTLVAGDAWNTGLLNGVLYQLNTTRQVSWAVAPVGTKVATLRVDVYSDSGGSTRVCTGLAAVNVVATV